MELVHTHEEYSRMKEMKRKLKSQSGESIGETLIALLIAALALVMLAGAISSSSGTIQKSKKKLNDYYSANEESSGVVKMTSGGTSGVVILTDGTSAMLAQSYGVTFFKNDIYSQKTVVAYKEKGISVTSSSSSSSGGIGS